MRRRADKSFVRTGHGNGAGVPRIEIPPVDELSAGVPAAPSSPEIPPAPVVTRLASGRLADSKSAAELGRLGAIAANAKRQQLRTLENLGLRGAPTEALLPYLPDAEAFAAHEIQRLAQEVGGGTCAPAASSMVQSGALQLAGSRCAFASGQLQLGSRLADASRQNLLAAHELCAREAMARSRPGVRVPVRDVEHDALVRQRVAEASARAAAPADFDVELEEDAS